MTWLIYYRVLLNKQLLFFFFSVYNNKQGSKGCVVHLSIYIKVLYDAFFDLIHIKLGCSGNISTKTRFLENYIHFL